MPMARTIQRADRSRRGRTETRLVRCLALSSFFRLLHCNGPGADLSYSSGILFTAIFLGRAACSHPRRPRLIAFHAPPSVPTTCHHFFRRDASKVKALRTSWPTQRQLRRWHRLRHRAPATSSYALQRPSRPSMPRHAADVPYPLPLLVPPPELHSPPQVLRPAMARVRQGQQPPEMLSRTHRSRKPNLPRRWRANLSSVITERALKARP